MRAGATISASCALDDYLASLDFNKEPESSSVPKQAAAMKIDRLPILGKIGSYNSCQVSIICCLNVLSTWFRSQTLVWAAIAAPDTLQWLEEHLKIVINIEMDGFISHCILCFTYMASIIWVFSCEDFLFKCIILHILKCVSGFIFGPVVFGLMIAWVLRSIKRKTVLHYSLIRRCLHLMRRTHLLSIGAVSSFPLPPFTGIEDSAESYGSFMSHASLKSIRSCIHSGLCKLNGLFHGRNSGATESFASCSVKNISDEANVMLRGKIQLYIYDLLALESKSASAAEAFPCINNKRKCTGLSLLGGICNLLNNFSLPLATLWTLVVVSTVLSQCQYCLISKLKDLNVQHHILSVVSEGDGHADCDSRLVAVEDQLRNELGRLLTSINKLRLSHEWESIRLWNCELEIQRTINSSCLLNSGTLSRDVVELNFVKIASFLRGLPIPLTPGSTCLDHLQSSNRNNTLDYVPRESAWIEISAQLAVVMNNYLISTKGSEVLESSGIQILTSDESSSTDSPEINPVLLHSTQYRTVVTGETDEYCIDTTSIESSAREFQSISVVDESAKCRIVDIYSGVATQEDMSRDRKEVHDTPVIEQRASIGLLGELKHHVAMSIINKGLFERENGGDLVPLAIPPVVGPATTAEANPISIIGDETDLSSCNLVGDSKTIHLLNSDLAAVLQVRKIGKVHRADVVLGASSDEEYD